MRRVAADRGMCGSSLQWRASHCPSLNPQCWQGSQDTCARRDTRSGCSVHRYLEWIVLFASVWHSQGFNPFPVLRDCTTGLWFEPLFFPRVTVYVFSDHSPHIFLFIFVLSLTDRKSSISSSPAIYFSLSSAELAIPASPVLPPNSTDFCIHRSLVTTKLNVNSCGNQ